MRMTARGWMAMVGALAAAAGCDASYQQFLNGIPTGTKASTEPVQVYLGIDGLSRQAFDRARERGAFAGWNSADLVTPFPGTSDYVWTRIMRAGSLGGYEIQYFDARQNKIENGGLSGLAQHPLHEGIAGTFPCYQRFDFVGDGETWQLKSYLDPMAALPETLDALFNTVAGRGRTQAQVLAYVINIDVAGHQGGLEQAVLMLLEIDRRIRVFQNDQPRRFAFTIFADHGNAHIKSTLVDPMQILRDVGIEPVESLAAANAPAATPRRLEAVPIVHVRVNYVALHAAARDVAAIAARSSGHPQVDLAVARVTDGGAATASRFGVWRRGQPFFFSRDAAGEIVIEEPDAWTWLGVDFTASRSADGRTARLGDRDAFQATLGSPYPDIFYRVATAFTHPAAQFPADVLLSLPDDVASYGFSVPGAGDARAVDGFHGSLSRASTMSVVASQEQALPPALRGDDLMDLFPAMAPR